MVDIPNPFAGLNGFKKEMCDKYTTSAEQAYNQLSRLNSATRGPMNEIKRNLNKLKSKATTPVNKLRSKLGDVASLTAKAIPDFSDENTLNSFIKKCTPLGDLMNGTGSLTDAIEAVKKSTQNLVDDMIFKIAMPSIMFDVPEFDIGFDMNGLDKLFVSFKIPDILGGLDGLIDCIEKLCPGVETQKVIRATNELQNTMGFTDNGLFDSQALMTNVGMPPDKIANLTTTDGALKAMGVSTQALSQKSVTDLFKREAAKKKLPFVGKISKYF